MSRLVEIKQNITSFSSSYSHAMIAVALRDDIDKQQVLYDLFEMYRITLDLHLNLIEEAVKQPIITNSVPK